MTELDSSTLIPPSDAAGRAAAREAPSAPVSYTRKILRLTFERISAQLGVYCIAIIALLAAFAPFLANSYPIALKEGGRWRSPLFQNLTPVDVTLQATFWAVVVLSFFRSTALVIRAGLLVLIVTVSGVMAGFFVHPPQA